MRRTMAWLVALCLLLTGCSGGRGSGERKPGEYELWFTNRHTSPESAALGRETRTLSDGEELLELLLRGPESEALTSPFPAETALRGSRVEEGTAWVDLSEAYGGLTGAELTLADACIVLTLCQLDGVEQVYITVEGEPRPYRDQVFSPDDFLLDNTLGESKEK